MMASSENPVVKMSRWLIGNSGWKTSDLMVNLRMVNLMKKKKRNNSMTESFGWNWSNLNLNYKTVN